MLGSGDTPQKAAVSRRLGCPPAPDRWRRRYTCRGGRSTAAASPLEIAPGRRGWAAHRSSAPFFTPQNRTSSSSPPPPSHSLYTAATPPGPSALVESTKSRLDSSRGSGSRPNPASTTHAMHGRSIPSGRDCRRHAVASPLAFPLSYPLASFCVVSGFGTACLSSSITFRVSSSNSTPASQLLQVEAAS